MLIGRESRIVILGDSITAIFLWYQPLLKALASGTRAQVRDARSGGLAWWQGTPYMPTVYPSGVSGDATSDVVGAVTSRVLAYSPTNVIVELGINDTVKAMTDAATRTNVRSILAQMIAGGIHPTRIMWLTPMCWGEAWKAGPTWGDNPQTSIWIPSPTNVDPDIDSKTQIIREEVASAGAELVELRTTALAYEVANNAGKASSGILTGDGLHPNATGSQWMSDRVAAQITFV